MGLEVAGGKIPDVAWGGRVPWMGVAAVGCRCSAYSGAEWDGSLIEDGANMLNNGAKIH